MLPRAYSLKPRSPDRELGVPIRTPKSNIRPASELDQVITAQLSLSATEQFKSKFTNREKNT